MERSLTAWMLTLLLAPGCGSSAASAPNALDAADRRVLRAVARAASDAERAEDFVGMLRHNPARCDCPAWELRVGRDWVRADVRPQDPSATPAWLRSPPTNATTFEARVRITRASVQGANGWLYPVLEAVADRL